MRPRRIIKVSFVELGKAYQQWRAFKGVDAWCVPFLKLAALFFHSISRGLIKRLQKRGSTRWFVCGDLGILSTGMISGLDCRIPGPLNVLLKKLPPQSRSRVCQSTTGLRTVVAVHFT